MKTRRCVERSDVELLNPHDFMSYQFSCDFPLFGAFTGVRVPFACLQNQIENNNFLRPRCFLHLSRLHLSGLLIGTSYIHRVWLGHIVVSTDCTPMEVVNVPLATMEARRLFSIDAH